MTDDEQALLQTIRDLLRLYYDRRDWRTWKARWHARAPELTAAVRVLSRDQAQLLAHELWTRYAHDQIINFFGQLITSVPGALAEWSAPLATQGYLRPGWLYLGASPSATSQLLALVDQPAVVEDVSQCADLLQALAWIDDEHVREQFRAWRETPPPWQSRYLFPAHACTIYAGWELTPEGGRRDLYLPTSYELIPADEPQFTPSQHAVAVSTPTDESCRWCGRKLVALLDIDLRDPRCAFVVVAGDEEAASNTVGSRLCIVHCQWCTWFTTLYTDVDLEGGVRWSDANEDMPSILQKVGLGAGQDLPPAAQRLVLGAQRRTPFEAVGRFLLDEPGISQVGGHPDWIQNPEFPICPGCQRRMRCIGQVSWEDIKQFAEGSTYAFLCLPCGKGATTYQQT